MEEKNGEEKEEGGETKRREKKTVWLFIGVLRLS